MKVSDVEIHHDRHVVFSKQIRHGAVLVEFPEFLSELQRAANQKAFHILEPAGVLHLPDCAADRKDVQIARFQKPDKTVLFIFFHKINRSVVLRSKNIDETVETAADESSLKCTVRIREAAQNARFCNLVRQIRIFLASALRIVSFPSLIKADIAAYLDKKKGYKKNAYKYETRTVELVEKHWDYALKQWDYKLE